MESLFLPNYTIGSDAYNYIDDICKNYGSNAVIISGKKSLNASRDILLKSLKNINVTAEIYYGGVASYENVEMLKNIKEIKEADMVFAVGGGRCVDTVKTLCDMINKPLFTFPTLASNCAAVTSLSVMYNSDDSYKNLYTQKRPAIHTFINTDIILNSPERYFIAGMGDALSKQYETLFSTRNEVFDYKNFLGYEIIKECSNDIIKYSLKAFNDFKNKKPTDDFNRVVLHIVYTTGLTSVTMRDDYHISLPHAVYNGLTRIKEIGENFFHGELVAYGILLLLTMDKKFDELEKVFNFNKSLSLPTSIKAIGIKDISLENEELSKVLEGAYVSKDLEVSPYPITKDMIINAMLELEEYNIKKAL
ncbi:iron-containing alcohol dehydrogenase family protein [Brachyspira pilosicoli]|uniref:iron-containing alcohol dehydrogenase family protein n=1 Tax=Brachyspira pilosicoli TaxID=52584 RepID=UPI0012F4FDC5|nr:iron-containing alcohol dehydrogenase family protein [Brachyspira pilosicoli]